MKVLKLKKVIASSLIIVSVLSINTIGASAEWKQDSNGWWNTDESLGCSVGWKEIDGYNIGSDGACIQSTQNNLLISAKNGTIGDNNATTDKFVTSNAQEQAELNSESIYKPTKQSRD